MRTHVDIEFGSSILQTQVEFTFIAGRPAYYNRGGSFDPPDPPEVDVVKVLIRSADAEAWHEAPPWLADILAADEWLTERLIEAAEQDRQDREDNSRFGMGT